MILDLSDEQARAPLNLLIDTIEADRFPNSPRIRLLRQILGQCGEVGGLPPELAARLRRYGPQPPAPPRRQRSATPLGGPVRADAGKGWLSTSTRPHRAGSEVARYQKTSASHTGLPEGALLASIASPRRCDRPGHHAMST